MADFTGVSLFDMINGGVLVRESIPGRLAAFADLGGATLTTQVMLSVAMPCLAGDVVSKIAFRSGATAAGTPTNYWFALYDPNGALVAQTADQLTAAWAASTTKDLSLVQFNVSGSAVQSYVLQSTGVYYAAVMVKATTVPSLVGVSQFDAAFSGGLVTGQKQIAQTSGAALTTTAPATIATPTAVVNRAYAVMH